MMIWPPNLAKKVQREIVESLPELELLLETSDDGNVVHVMLSALHIRIWWEHGYYEIAFGPRDNRKAIFASPDVLTCIGASGESLASMDANKTVAALRRLLAHRAPDLVRLFEPERYEQTLPRVRAAQRLRGLRYPTL